jgi:hypothetical protein
MERLIPERVPHPHAGHRAHPAALGEAEARQRPADPLGRLGRRPRGSSLYNEVVGWARQIRDFGAPVYFTFHHEPETSCDIAYGMASQYIDAWRRVVSIFRQEGASDARFLWILADYSFEVPSSDRRAAFKWYPGDEWVDGLAADAYNWHNCRQGINTPWRSLAQIIEGFRRFGAAHPSEEMWLGEWASAEDPASPGRKAAWITEATALFKQPAYSQFRGISYFHNGYSSGTFANCDWWLDFSQSGFDAFAAMGADVFYQATGPDSGPDVTPPETTITSGTVGTSVSFGFSSSEVGSSFECALDGASFAGCVSPQGYSDLADAAYTFTVRATDVAGNIDPTPAVREFTVDSVVPVPLITFRGAMWNGSPEARSVVTVARPAGTVPGDVMVASIVSNDDDPTFSAPAGWSLVREDAIVDGLRQAVYVKTAGAAEPNSYTWTMPTTRRLAGGIVTYAGVDPVNPVNVHGARRNTFASTSVTAPSVTTTVDGALLVHLTALNAEGTISPSPGMTERWEVTAWRTSSTRDATAATADTIQTTAGLTGTGTATTTQSGRSICVLVALQPLVP